jgi:hypothetical protein
MLLESRLQAPLRFPFGEDITECFKAVPRFPVSVMACITSFGQVMPV